MANISNPNLGCDERRDRIFSPSFQGVFSTFCVFQSFERDEWGADAYKEAAMGGRGDSCLTKSIHSIMKIIRMSL